MKKRSEPRASAADVTPLDDDTKRRLLADLERFQAMRERVGALPTVQEFEQLKGTDPDAQRKRSIMMLVVRSHTLIGHITSEIIESEDHYHDVQKEIRINSLWREIVTLRDIVPKAVIGANRIKTNQQIARDRKPKLPDINVETVLAEVGKGVTLKVIAGKCKCSQSHLSEIIKKHGGAVEIRKQYRHNRGSR